MTILGLLNGLVLYERKKWKGKREKVNQEWKKVKKLEKQSKALKEKVPKPSVKEKVLMAQKLKKARASATKGLPVGPRQFFQTVSRMVQLRKVG